LTEDLSNVGENRVILGRGATAVRSSTIFYYAYPFGDMLI